MQHWKIIPTPHFEKEAKKLAKRYPSLKTDLIELSKTLLQNPHQGTSLGHHAYKVRLSIKSKGKGKSGGARVITYLVNPDSTIFLLSIYDKSEISTISDKELKKIIAEIKPSR